jgi:hypothetical protein
MKGVLVRSGSGRVPNTRVLDSDLAGRGQSIVLEFMLVAPSWAEVIPSS